MRIQLLRADVTSMKVDAMVSPSESGEAESGANLLCKFVIPAKVPPVAAANAEEELRSATMKAPEDPRISSAARVTWSRRRSISAAGHGRFSASCSAYSEAPLTRCLSARCEISIDE
jgi:hypothetical protein